MKKEEDLSLVYNYAPAARKLPQGKNPMLVMAHGYGADENDLFSLGGEFPDVFHIVAPRAPIDLPYGGAAWYSLGYEGDKMVSDISQAVAAREKLAEFIGQAVEKHDADPDHVWLLGFSQGAILSYGIMSKYPGLIQRYIPLSGYVERGVIDESVDQNDYSGVKALAMHGTMDPVIPIQAGRGVQDFMRDLGVDYQYYEFPIGHGISPDGMSHIRRWVDQQMPFAWK